MERCYVCQAELETQLLRPYGENGQPICHPCAKSSPERWAEAQRRMNAAAKASFDRNGVAIVTPEGFK